MERAVDHSSTNAESLGKNIAQINTLEFFAMATD
jgi:hypothetical protein